VLDRLFEAVTLRCEVLVVVEDPADSTAKTAARSSRPMNVALV
jgi:hypothetical protein